MPKHVIELPVSTDERILRDSWFGEYYETLSHKRGAVDLSWLNSGHAKVLMDHDRKRPVGRIIGARLDDDAGRVVAQFEFDDEIDEGRAVLERVQSGLYDNVSVGWDWRMKDLEVQTGDEIPDNEAGAEDAITFKRWKPIEVSFVSTPADENVGVGRALNAQHPERIREAILGKKQQQRRATMPDPTPNPEPTPAAPEPTPVRNNPPAPEPTPEPTRQTRAGYDAIIARRAYLRRHLSQDAIDTLQDNAVNEGWDRQRANEEMMAALENSNPAVADGNGGSAPGSLTQRGDNAGKYSLARAVQEAVAGRLKSGSGSLEAELHKDAAERSGIRTLAENEFSLPWSLLAQDRTLMRGILKANAERLGGQRNTPGPATVQSNATNAGMLIDEFDEFHLVEELYPRAGLFGRVRIFPQMLSQDLKVPVEDKLADAGWLSQAGGSGLNPNNDPEVNDRADTPTPRYPNNLEWSWKEVYAQFGITRKLIDQTAYLYDRVMRCIQRDIPRRINTTLYYGDGSAGTPKGITHADYAIGAIVPSTAGSGTATRYSPLTWEQIVQFQTEMEDDNADYLGGAYYFAPSKVIGKLMTTERFTGAGGVNGQPILRKNDMGAGSIDGIEVVRDNHINHNTAVTTIGSQSVTGHPAVSDLFYGIPQEIVLGYFSEMMMIVDPYTAKKKGQIEVQFRQAMDWQLEHAEAWVRCAAVVT